MSTNCRIFVLRIAFVKVLGCIPIIICIAQITFEIINNTLPIPTGGLISLGLRSCPNFLLTKTGCTVTPNLCLDYPVGLINSTINNFILHNASENRVVSNTNDSGTVRISIPFKDQEAANAVRKQLRDLSHKIGVTVQPFLQAHGCKDLLKEYHFKVLRKCQNSLRVSSLI